MPMPPNCKAGKKSAKFRTQDDVVIREGMILWSACTNDSGNTFALSPHRVTRIRVFGVELNYNTAWTVLNPEVRYFAYVGQAAIWVLSKTATLATKETLGRAAGKRMSDEMKKLTPTRRRRA